LASAQQPVPDSSYGSVQQDGANISPEQQPVVAIIRGGACGAATTLLAPAGSETPPEDVGKTVYAIDILADGSGPGQRAGCGQSGDQVLFYFPVAGRLATQTAVFQPGVDRLNLDLGAPLTTRLTVQSVSDDGPLQ